MQRAALGYILLLIIIYILSRCKFCSKIAAIIAVNGLERSEHLCSEVSFKKIR
jgi:hypothetical protein